MEIIKRILNFVENVESILIYKAFLNNNSWHK